MASPLHSVESFSFGAWSAEFLHSSHWCSPRLCFSPSSSRFRARWASESYRPSMSQRCPTIPWVKKQTSSESTTSLWEGFKKRWRRNTLSERCRLWVNTPEIERRYRLEARVPRPPFYFNRTYNYGNELVAFPISMTNLATSKATARPLILPSLSIK